MQFLTLNKGMIKNGWSLHTQSHESIVNQRKHKENTCPSEHIITENKAKESEENIRWFESLNKMKISFQLLMDSMKFTFNFQRN